MKVTKREIEYRATPYGKIATIPKGTPVTPASNLPDGGYWVLPWKNMTKNEYSWMNSYGFHLTEQDVEEK